MRISLPRPETRNTARSVWLFFAIVHVGFLARLLPFIIGGGVLSDVRFYRQWAFAALNGGVWEGIDTAWVYPAGALAPMVVAAALGPYLYMLTWFLLFAGLNAVGTAALMRRRTGSSSSSAQSSPSSFTAAYWWLTATALLGPVAVGRIDGLTAPLVILGLLMVGTRPFVASLVLSAATWMKVWH